MTKIIEYQYKEDILEEVRSLTVQKLCEGVGNEYYKDFEVSKTHAFNVYNEIKENLYFISPDPMNIDFKVLVFEEENVNYFYPVDESRHVQKNLENQYNGFYGTFIGFNNYFKKFIPYNKFMKGLPHYKESKLLSRDILLGDGYIYNFEDMKFMKKSYEVPSLTCDREFKELKENDEKILDICFKNMYSDVEDWRQFLYYILCNLDKNYQRQNIFLIIDASGVGKTAKIIPMVHLKLNKIFQSGLLKSSELYNIAGKNSIIYNETQTDKNINGSDLSLLADSTPLTVTRKNTNSLDIEAEDKPLLQIMGESLPFFKSLNNGTNRRFLLVPKVDEEFIAFKEDPKNKDIVGGFYDLLYNRPVEVIQYYVKKINEEKIKDNIQTLNKSMEITLKELENLLESKETIFSKFFELEPYGKHEDYFESRYLLNKDSLDMMLEYIDTYEITTSHFNDPALRLKYFRKLIKENRGVSNLKKDIGISHCKEGYFLYYACLTDEGVKLVNEINQKKIFKKKLIYHIA